MIILPFYRFIFGQASRHSVFGGNQDHMRLELGCPSALVVSIAVFWRMNVFSFEFCSRNLWMLVTKINKIMTCDLRLLSC